MNDFIGLIVIFVTAVVLVFVIEIITMIVIKSRQKKSIVLNHPSYNNVLSNGDISFYLEKIEYNPYTGKPMVLSFKSNFVPFKTAKNFIEENDEKYLTYNFTEYNDVVFDHKYKNDVFSIIKSEYDIEHGVSMVLRIANLPVLEKYIKEKNKNKINYSLENFKWHSFCKQETKF